MRILMFLASTGRGGAETLVAALANTLSRQHDVGVLLFDNAEWRGQLSDSVRIIPIGPSRSRRNPLLRWRLKRAIREFDADIIHSHSAKAAYLMHALAGAGTAPHLATKHNPRPGRIFDRVAHVAAVSTQVADSIDGPSTVIRNGIQPLPDIQPKTPDGPFTLLAIGRLDPLKGFDLLIQALQDTSEDIHLDIIGEGPERDRLRQLIDMLSLQQRVRLLGHRNDIPQRMANAHGVVISSHSEGFGLVIIESLYYANVLLSTNVGAAAELLPPILLTSHANLAGDLNRLQAHYRPLCNEFNNARHDALPQFDIRNTAKHYEALYTELTKLRATPEIT